MRLKTRWPDDLLRSVLFATVVHLFCILAVNSLSSFTSVKVDLEAAALLAAGRITYEGGAAPDVQDANGLTLKRNPIEALTDYPVRVGLYLFVACVVGGLAGHALRKFESSCDWGRSIAKFFRSEHETEKYEEWREWFFGFPDPEQDEVAFRLLATVVTFGGTPFLFTGELVNMHPDENGDPERFELRNVSRRPLNDDTADFYEIKGDGMILRLSEMTTINMHRFFIEGIVETIPSTDHVDESAKTGNEA
ncbi:hypothetical protein [Maioricimonas sp. JC845]|uniref:hypothetical protein n=1 Tax=Maioricimonas sp. JC845 TaxID=3232138 RepID=UPI0034592D05